MNHCSSSSPLCVTLWWFIPKEYTDVCSSSHKMWKSSRGISIFRKVQYRGLNANAMKRSSRSMYTKWCVLLHFTIENSIWCIWLRRSYLEHLQSFFSENFNKIIALKTFVLIAFRFIADIWIHNYFCDVPDTSSQKHTQQTHFLVKSASLEACAPPGRFEGGSKCSVIASNQHRMDRNQCLALRKEI